jgi:hypothetical protein
MAFTAGPKIFPQKAAILELVKPLPGKLCRRAGGLEGISFDGFFIRS